MRTLGILLFGVVAGAIVSKANPPVQVPQVESQTLAPSDLGMRKWIFEAKPESGKVMVLRRTSEYKNIKQGTTSREIKLDIQLTNGAPARQSVIYYNPTDTLLNRAKGGDTVVMDDDYAMIVPGMSPLFQMAGPKSVALGFKDPQGNTQTITYDCFVDDYANQKRNIPALPDASPVLTWRYHHMFNE